MVDGSKKWYFIDPYDSYICAPLFRSGVAAGGCLAMYPDDYDESVMPAMKYCPYYSVELQAGDVMLNPSWWYHAIR